MATLITGGGGLIGTKVAGRLLESGEEVVVFDVHLAPERVDPLNERFGDRVTALRGDVLALGTLADAVRRHGVDGIVHLSYLLGAESNENPGQATLTNIVGTTNVLEVARLFDVPRVVMASSIAVYGSDERYRAEELPLHEDAAPYVAAGLPIYGGGKVYMEQLAALYRRQYGVEAVGLRPSIVYGPGRRTGSTGWVVALIEDPALDRPVRVGFGNAKMSLVYVEDVADQFVALLRAPAACFQRHRFFNSGGDTCTMQELAEVVRGIIPDAAIDVSAGEERDLAGLAATVTDRGLRETVGFSRRFAPLEEGVRAHMNVVRQLAGRPPL
jgi:UDP-glucose 4-epimerase